MSENHCPYRYPLFFPCVTHQLFVADYLLLLHALLNARLVVVIVGDGGGDHYIIS